VSLLLDSGIALPAEFDNTVPPPIGCRLVLFQVSREGCPEEHDGDQEREEGYGPLHEKEGKDQVEGGNASGSRRVARYKTTRSPLLIILTIRRCPFLHSKRD